jgi:hypothetical protein
LNRKPLRRTSREVTRKRSKSFFGSWEVFAILSSSSLKD